MSSFRLVNNTSSMVSIGTGVPIPSQGSAIVSSVTDVIRRLQRKNVLSVTEIPTVDGDTDFFDDYGGTSDPYTLKLSGTSFTRGDGSSLATQDQLDLQASIGLSNALTLTGGQMRIGGVAPDVSQQAAALVGLGLGDSVVIRTPPSALVLPSALSGLKAFGTPGHPETWRANITADDLIDSSLYVNTYWVDADGGSDTNSGLSWALRKQSISSAYNAAQAAAAPARIYVKGDTAIPYHRALSLCNGGIVSGVHPIIFEAINGRVNTGVFDIHTWTKTSNYYSTVITDGNSHAGRCLNTKVKDKRGMHSEYKWVASSAAVDAERGTWFYDSGTKTVYVRTHDDSPADVFTARVIPYGIYRRAFEWGTPANLFVRGFDVEGGYNGAIRCNLALNDVSGQVVLDDSTFRFSCRSNVQSGGTAVVDSAQIIDCGQFIAAFNCDFSASHKDGFNVHKKDVSGSMIGPFSLLVNCRGVKNGASISTSNQGYTLHEGLHGVTIGCNWTENRSGGIGHASAGTISWSVGDVAGATYGDVDVGGRPGYGFGNVDGAGVLYLDYCQDVGAEYGLYNEDTGTIYQHGHKGIGKRSANVIAY